MSTTERYGTMVWDAIVSLDREGRADKKWFHSAGEVAARAGVSVPTAKKYLDKLCEMGNVVWVANTWGWKFYGVMETVKK